jgi:hypothetical protein
MQAKNYSLRTINTIITLFQLNHLKILLSYYTLNN